MPPRSNPSRIEDRRWTIAILDPQSSILHRFFHAANSRHRRWHRWASRRSPPHGTCRRNGRSIDIKLLEASGRLGGSIATERVGEFLVEAGPDSFITEKPWALRLCERIGLTHRLVSTQSAYQKIFIVHNGKLVALPEGFFLLAPTRLWPFIQTPLFSWPGKLRMAGELLLPRGEAGDESLGAFVRRRFGNEALERVAQPLVGGIYAADPDKLSLGATMPRFKEMERDRRSVIFAMWSAQRQRARQAETGSGARWSLFVTLAGGMQELVDTLAERLPDDSVRLNCAARQLKLGANGKSWEVAAGDNHVIDADAVVLATPAFRAGEFAEPHRQQCRRRIEIDFLRFHRHRQPRLPPRRFSSSAEQLWLRRARHRET